MTLSEFEQAFDQLWSTKYTTYDPEVDHWTVERRDGELKQQLRETLLDYARSIQDVGLSRRGKNKAQRLFDELEIDPATLQFGTSIREPGSGQIENANEINKAPGKSRVMYIERKSGQLTGEARIGRVIFSKTGRTIYYGGMSFRSLDGTGFKANYYCVENGEEYWISGCKRNGGDRLYGERVPIHVDEDAREEYWVSIRKLPGCIDQTSA